MDRDDTLIKTGGSQLQGAFRNLVATHYAEACARLRALISLGTIAGPEGRQAIGEELRTIFAEMRTVTALGRHLDLPG